MPVRAVVEGLSSHGSEGLHSFKHIYDFISFQPYADKDAELYQVDLWINYTFRFIGQTCSVILILSLDPLAICLLSMYEDIVKDKDVT